MTASPLSGGEAMASTVAAAAGVPAPPAAVTAVVAPASAAAPCALCAAAAAPGEAVSLPGSAIPRFLESVQTWLSTFPANPVNNFLQGALLLVRRTLWPSYGAPTSQWNDGWGTDNLWYRTQLVVPGSETLNWAPKLWATPGAPLVGTHTWLTRDFFGDRRYADDGVQGIIYNHTDAPVAVRAAGIFPQSLGDGYFRTNGIQLWQTAIVEPGGAVSYQLFNNTDGVPAIFDTSSVNFLSFYRTGVCNFAGCEVVGDPVFRLGLQDPEDWGYPSTYFEPTGVSPSPSPRWVWREGDEHHDIWGSIDVGVRREGDGWQINPSAEYLSQYPNPSTYNTSDWAIFTINLNSL